VLTEMYIVFAVVGCGYVLVSAFLGHAGVEGGGHAHVGGGHGDAGAVHAHHVGGDHHGLDAKGHGSARAHGGEAFHFPFVSPLAIATLLSAVGLYGLVALHGLHLAEKMSLLVALPAAFATAYGITYAAWKLASGSQGSSVIRMSSFAGSPAEVTVPIPPGGIGEAVAMVAGQRFAAPAREAAGREVARGMPVTVIEMVGPTLIVTVDQLLLPAGAGDNERGSDA